MTTEPARRRYDSPLREEQAAATRARILDAAIDLLAEEGAAAMTHRAIARRAQVSAPMVSRYFPTDEDIVDGIDGRITERLGMQGFPTTVDDLYALTDVVFRGMDREQRTMLAYLAAPRHVAHGRQKRRRGAERSAEQMFPQLPPEERRRLAALIHLFFSARTWQHFRESWGFDGGQTAEIVRFALRAAIATATEPKEPR